MGPLRTHTHEVTLCHMVLGGVWGLPMRVPNSSPALDKIPSLSWVEKLYPRLALGSGGRFPPAFPHTLQFCNRQIVGQRECRQNVRKCGKMSENVSDNFWTFFAYLVNVFVWRPCPMLARCNSNSVPDKLPSTNLAALRPGVPATGTRNLKVNLKIA